MTTALLTPETHSPLQEDATLIRVCHVSLTLKTGGLERILADLARHHDPSVCELSFVALRDVGRFADEISDAGCPVWKVPATSRWGQIRTLARWLRARQIDVVHTHNTYPHLYATIAARMAGVPVVVQTRHGQRAGHGWKSRILYRAATLLADRVVSVSDDAARLCLQADGLPARKVERIWNGIDLTNFAYHGPVDDPIAVSVGRLSPEKDFPTLLHAMAAAVGNVPELRLLIVGDGPERSRLEQLVGELKLSNSVQLLGERHDVPEILETAAFYVSSSVTEGISLTLLEAMAVGLPVVATDAGGNPEIVVPGVTGDIVPTGNVAALAEAITRMAQRPQTWKRLGAAGRQRVCDHFDVRRMSRDYEALYLRLLQGRRHSGSSSVTTR